MGIRSGLVHVNTYGGSDITTPMGGMKQSGNGVDKSLHANDTSVAEASRFFDVTLVGIADGPNRRSSLHPDRIALLGGRADGP